MFKQSALLALLAIGPLTAQTDPNVLTRLLTTYKSTPTAFSFAAMGDQQYGAAGEAKWPALSKSISDAAPTLKFVVHAGDIKSGSTLCTNEMFANRLEGFNAIQLPVILTPGDNEWTDCHRANNGAYDPLERLAYERNIFYSTDESLGAKKIKVFRESEDPRYTLYRENAIWTEGNVVFATVHVIGSNNNLGRTPEQDVEYRARNIANLNWVHTAFSLARDGEFGGIVFTFQADPPFPRGIDGALLTPDTGFTDFIYALETESIVFNKPVLLIHGDSHTFRVDKPMVDSKDKTVIENIYRLEVPGSSDSHWVRVNINPAKPNSLFSFEHEDVLANRVRHTIQ
ncbi:MAG: hypothetical protein ABI972_01910 [Acidobacteriota bacterium]